jgi:hypothetical protein
MATLERQVGGSVRFTPIAASCMSIPVQICIAELNGNGNKGGVDVAMLGDGDHEPWIGRASSNSIAQRNEPWTMPSLAASPLCKYKYSPMMEVSEK